MGSLLSRLACASRCETIVQNQEEVLRTVTLVKEFMELQNKEILKIKDKVEENTELTRQNSFNNID